MDELDATEIVCCAIGCGFQRNYCSWTVACLAAGRHTAATGHTVDVSARRTKTFTRPGRSATEAVPAAERVG